MKSMAIEREFGSGGRDIGIRIAKEAQIPYYDGQLLIEAAKRYGIEIADLKEFDENKVGSLLYNIAMMAGYNQYENMDRTRDKFMVESSAYLLCQKYGIEVPNVNFSKEVSKYFDGMDTQEIKQELANIKELYDDVSKRVDRGIYHFEQNKTVQHNQEVR